MGFRDLLGDALDAPVAAIRRHVISLAIAVSAAIGAVFYAASAAMLALENALGPIAARAGVAAILLAIAIGGYFTPRLLSGAAAQPVADAGEDAGMTRDQKIATVFEALLLGFSMGSRKPAADNSDGQK